METVHGPKLAALVEELYQPLDLGEKEYTYNTSSRSDLTMLCSQFVSTKGRLKLPSLDILVDTLKVTFKIAVAKYLTFSLVSMIRSSKLCSCNQFPTRCRTRPHCQSGKDFNNDHYYCSLFPLKMV